MTTVTIISDITYACIDGTELQFDLYRPNIDGPVPAVIYLHSGGGVSGDKTTEAQTRLQPLASHGIAVLSANYRLAPTAFYSAQIHDVKAAVRWARAHGSEYGLATDNIGLWGSSVGAVFASLVGLTSGDPEREGTVGEDRNQSSVVQAVIHWFGSTDFVTTNERTPIEARILPPPWELALFGPGTVGEIAAIARHASSLERVSPAAPPILIMHGDRDHLAPIAEAEAFHNALSHCGANSTFVSVAGAGHDDDAFASAANIGIVAAFLHAHLTPSLVRPAAHR